MFLLLRCALFLTLYNTGDVTMYIALSSGERLYENSIVMLRGSSDRYIVKRGWFSYDDTNRNGWYFQSISDNSVIPVTAQNVVGISILENGDFVQNVEPTEVPAFDISQMISVYKPNTKYLAGQIVYQEFGKLYQVCAAYISNTVENDVSNGYLTPISFGADAPYTNSVSSDIHTVGDALDYIISNL